MPSGLRGSVYTSELVFSNTLQILIKKGSKAYKKNASFKGRIKVANL